MNMLANISLENPFHIFFLFKMGITKIYDRFILYINLSIYNISEVLKMNFILIRNILECDLTSTIFDTLIHFH